MNLLKHNESLDVPCFWIELRGTTLDERRKCLEIAAGLGFQYTWGDNLSVFVETSLCFMLSDDIYHRTANSDVNTFEGYVLENKDRLNKHETLIYSSAEDFMDGTFARINSMYFI